MNKQEAIEKIERAKIVKLMPFVDYVLLEVAVDTIDQIDEPQKVVVPKCVAEWIDKAKQNGYSLYSALDLIEKGTEAFNWLFNSYPGNNEEIFVRAWLDGYEVEQEKLYIVEFPTGQQLYKNHPNGSSKTAIVIKFANRKEEDGHFTKSELDESGYSWVFNCDGVKILEVE